MNHLLSIGKFAALCDTTTDTLIHYDQLGLLKPSQVTEGHRRLYDVQQYHRFCLIQTLADMGTPLQEINTFLQTKMLSEQIKILQAKEIKLKQQIQCLEKTISYTQCLHSLTEHSRELPNQAFIQNYTTTRPLFCTLFPYPANTICHLSQALQLHISQCTQKQIYPFPLGILAQRRDRGLPQKKHLFITSPLEHGSFDNQSVQRPPGDYATIYHNGTLANIHQAVDMLYEYIYKHHFGIAGDTFITLYLFYD